MQVSLDIIKEAEGLLSEGVPLPSQLPSFPQFYVGKEFDNTISVHTTIEKNGEHFVIGGLKNRTI